MSFLLHIYFMVVDMWQVYLWCLNSKIIGCAEVLTLSKIQDLNLLLPLYMDRILYANINSSISSFCHNKTAFTVKPNFTKVCLDSVGSWTSFLVCVCIYFSCLENWAKRYIKHLSIGCNREALAKIPHWTVHGRLKNSSLLFDLSILLLLMVFLLGWWTLMPYKMRNLLFTGVFTRTHSLRSSALLSQMIILLWNPGK